MRWQVPPLSRRRAIRSRRAGACSISPLAMASPMRGRSCMTTRPAPMLRWPTSELPICPSGRPTSRPDVRGGHAGRSPTGGRSSACAPGARRCRRGPRASPSRPAPPASPGDVSASAHTSSASGTPIRLLASIDATMSLLSAAFGASPPARQRRAIARVPAAKSRRRSQSIEHRREIGMMASHTRERAHEVRVVRRGQVGW